MLQQAIGIVINTYFSGEFNLESSPQITIKDCMNLCNKEGKTRRKLSVQVLPKQISDMVRNLHEKNKCTMDIVDLQGNMQATRICTLKQHGIKERMDMDDEQLVILIWD